MASSQVMRSKLLVPRSPTRRMGYLLRQGLYSAWMADRPLGHTPPRLMGLSGLPSMRTTRPSRTVAMMAHEQMHAWQLVYTFFSWGSTSSALASRKVPAVRPEPTPARTAVAATDFKKSRLDTVAWVIFILPLFETCIV